ncbi:MAG TPA: TorF family putative porin [Telluria sp.]
MLVALSLPVLATGAEAEAAPAPAAPGVIVNATLASQYISRGFRQGWGKPALQAGADYAHPSGWSAGTWMSSVSNRYIENGSLEVDLYGGYSGSAGAFGYSMLVYYYVYPGAEYKATATTYDYGELSFGMTWKMLYAKYNHTFTPEFFGITNARGTGYLDVGANIDLGAGMTLQLHAGNGRVAGAGNAVWDWNDAKIGLSKVYSAGWTATAAMTKAFPRTAIYDNYTLGIPNSGGVIETSNPGKATLVLSITKTF